MQSSVNLRRLVLCAAIAAWATCWSTPASAGKCAARRGAVMRAMAGLRRAAPVRVAQKQKDRDWIWLQVKIYDETYPLTVDLLAARDARPRKMMVMISPSGANFEVSYLGAANAGLAHFLAGNGYLVVGITHREDAVPLEDDHAVMANWGLRKHRRDVRRIVRLLQTQLRLRYDIMGFSFSAHTALDYAATYSGRLDRVIALDIFSIDPNAEPEKIEAAANLHAAYEQLMADELYSDISLAGLSDLLGVSAVDPNGDSGVPRAAFVPTIPGNFTWNGLLHFWTVFSAYMPGEHTPLSGLPRDWPLIKSTFAGDYTMDTDPLADTFELYHTDLDTVRAATAAMGSGAIPLALMRDATAAGADLTLPGAYTIDWSTIEEEVVWINAEEGYGTQTYGAELIRAAGNDDVTVVVIPGYGNADPLYGTDAAADVWRHIVEE